MRSSSLDYVSKGIKRAFERRRAMQQHAKQHLEQVVQAQSADRVAGDANTILTVNNTITKLSDDEYKAIIIEAAVNHIKQKKGK